MTATSAQRHNRRQATGCRKRGIADGQPAPRCNHFHNRSGRHRHTNAWRHVNLGNEYRSAAHIAIEGESADPSTGRINTAPPRYNDNVSHGDGRRYGTRLRVRLTGIRPGGACLLRALWGVDVQRAYSLGIGGESGDCHEGWRGWRRDCYLASGSVVNAADNPGTRRGASATGARFALVAASGSRERFNHGTTDNPVTGSGFAAARRAGCRRGGSSRLRSACRCAASRERDPWRRWRDELRVSGLGAV